MDTGILDNDCSNSEFLLNVKTKKKIRFKVGTELTSKVNVMDVNLEEDVTETHELLAVSIRFGSKNPSKIDPLVASN